MASVSHKAIRAAAPAWDELTADRGIHSQRAVPDPENYVLVPKFALGDGTQRQVAGHGHAWSSSPLPPNHLDFTPGGVFRAKHGAAVNFTDGWGSTSHGLFFGKRTAGLSATARKAATHAVALHCVGVYDPTFRRLAPGSRDDIVPSWRLRVDQTGPLDPLPGGAAKGNAATETSREPDANGTEQEPDYPPKTVSSQETIWAIVASLHLMWQPAFSRALLSGSQEQASLSGASDVDSLATVISEDYYTFGSEQGDVDSASNGSSDEDGSDAGGGLSPSEVWAFDAAAKRWVSGGSNYRKTGRP
ncbi:unnamed protein product [Amoebophrya sp. A120]|nr:unnamed protein product [Amoebophrya sp. A120]|eukprot:GSA120T00017517001.1